MPSDNGHDLNWYKVLDPEELPEGRVKTVTAGHRQLAMTHFEGQYGALDNKCPHQGGPLGEGSIENGYLRCPWHGWDYCPLDGKPPGGYDDGVATFPVEQRDDGIYVGLEEEAPHARTVTDVMVETMVNWGVTHVFGMVGHSNLGLADAFRRQEAAGNLTYIGIRHEGAASFAASAYAKLTGTPIASWLMNESDLLVVFGASFSNHTGITPKIPTIQVDFEPLALGKFHSVTVPVLGEIAVTCRQIMEQLGDTAATDQREDVAQRWKIWRVEKARRRKDDRGMGINSAAIFDSLTRLVPENAVIAVDVGNNTYSFGRYFECQQQSVLMSGYLGSIGFGFPAAMGAWAAAPDRPTVCITGDGGFGQYMGELTTAVKYGMNITHILLNNNELGKISKEQRAGEWEVWQTSLVNPDFAEYAKLCGAMGVTVSKVDQLDGAISMALAHDGPALVEVFSDAQLV